MDRDALLAAVRRMTMVGHTAREIGDALGVHKATVWRMRKELEITGRVNRPWTADELNKAALLFDDGCSLKEVSRTIGRPISSVRKKFPGRGWTLAQAAHHQRAIRDFEQIDWLDNWKIGSKRGDNVVQISDYRRA
jgi:transposase